MDYTYYVDEDGKVFRLHVETDDEPWNPREDMDGNIGTMFACMEGTNWEIKLAFLIP